MHVYIWMATLYLDGERQHAYFRMECERPPGKGMKGGRGAGAAIIAPFTAHSSPKHPRRLSHSHTLATSTRHGIPSTPRQHRRQRQRLPSS
jgi:hypothetical protein